MRQRTFCSMLVLVLVFFIYVSQVNADDTNVDDGNKAVPNVADKGNEWTPFQLTFYVPLQLYPTNWDVYGMRTNLIMGGNKNVYGLDIGGVIQVTDDTGVGIQIAHMLSLTSTFYGLQLGFVNLVKNKLTGMQIGFGNEAENMSGIQIGIIGNGFTFQPMGEYVKGIQLSGFANVVADCVKGIQIAILYNEAQEVNGLQIGVLNYAKKMAGVQIGLVNIIKESPLPFFPVINAHF